MSTTTTSSTTSPSNRYKHNTLLIEQHCWSRSVLTTFDMNIRGWLICSCESCFFFFTWLYVTEPHLLLNYGSCGLDNNPVWFSKANCRCHVQYTFIFKINGKKFILHSYFNTTQKTTLCPSQIRTRMGENIVKKWCKQCCCLAAVAKDMVPVILVFSLLVFSKLFASYLVHHL